MKRLLVLNDADAHCSKILASALRQRGNNVWLAYQEKRLDIDTPGKDSYELFESGLDHVMLVTDKQFYIKSRIVDDFRFEPPQKTDWIIENASDSDYASADCILSFEGDTIVAKDRMFSIGEVNSLITWLDKKHEK